LGLEALRATISHAQKKGVRKNYKQKKGLLIHKKTMKIDLLSKKITT